MNTTGFIAPRDEHDFGDRYYPFLQQYKFMICFENCKQSHYLTEKLANAYAAGCVPVYWGAPEARQWFNPNAFLTLEDESEAAMDALIDRMLELDMDDEAYSEVFRQPLLVDEIPPLMRLESMRERVAETLRRSRPDAF
jgi:alpha(1,3/1,4) fucosyltransferase